MSAICARLFNKGKVGVQRERETVGVPSFLPTAVGTALSQPRVRRCPSRGCGNLPRSAERNSSLNFSEKLSAR